MMSRRSWTGKLHRKLESKKWDTPEIKSGVASFGNWEDKQSLVDLLRIEEAENGREMEMDGEVDCEPTFGGDYCNEEEETCQKIISFPQSLPWLSLADLCRD